MTTKDLNDEPEHISKRNLSTCMHAKCNLGNTYSLTYIRLNLLLHLLPRVHSFYSQLKTILFRCARVGRAPE